MEPVVLILLLIYVLILLISVLEVTPLSVAALIGALLVAWFGIQYGAFTYQDALGFIDFRLLGLLIGTMIVVEVAKRGGLFNVFALYAIKFSGGHPGRLFVAICVVAALVNAHNTTSHTPRKIRKSMKVSPAWIPIIMLLTEPISVLVPPRFIMMAADRKYGVGL